MDSIQPALTYKKNGSRTAVFAALYLRLQNRLPAFIKCTGWALKLLTLGLASTVSYLHIAGQKNVDPALLKYISHQLVEKKVGKTIHRATGFIVKYKERLFLITNRHVLTGKDPFKDDHPVIAPDTIGIGFANPEKNTVLLQWFPLYKDKQPLFYLKSKYYDIGVLPIQIDGKFQKYIFPVEAVGFDTSINLAPDKNLIIVGFPSNCFPKNNWEPCSYSCKSLPSIDNAGVFRNIVLDIDTITLSGGSGSPVYIQDKTSKKLKVIAVNSIGFYMDRRGTAIYISYVKNILDSIVN